MVLSSRGGVFLVPTKKHTGLPPPRPAPPHPAVAEGEEPEREMAQVHQPHHLRLSSTARHRRPISGSSVAAAAAATAVAAATTAGGVGAYSSRLAPSASSNRQAVEAPHVINGCPLFSSLASKDDREEDQLVSCGWDGRLKASGIDVSRAVYGRSGRLVSPSTPLFSLWAPLETTPPPPKQQQQQQKTWSWRSDRPKTTTQQQHPATKLLMYTHEVVATRGALRDDGTFQTVQPGVYQFDVQAAAMPSSSSSVEDEPSAAATTQLVVLTVGGVPVARSHDGHLHATMGLDQNQLVGITCQQQQPLVSSSSSSSSTPPPPVVAAQEEEKKKREAKPRGSGDDGDGGWVWWGCTYVGEVPSAPPATLSEKTTNSGK